MTDQVKDLIPEDKATETGGSVNEVVSKDHVEKILREKKNAMEALKVAKEELAKRDKDKLVEQENYKELLTMAEKKAHELEEKLNRQTQLITDAKKVSSLKSELAKLGMQPQFVNDAIKLVDLSKIIVDEENNVVTGADLTAKLLSEKFPPLFQKVQGVPNESPVGLPKVLNMDDWKKLPVDEQKKRLPEFMQQLGLTK